MKDRSSYATRDIVLDIWQGLDLPAKALGNVSILNEDRAQALPSSFRVGPLAQSSILSSALSASLLYSSRNGTSTPKVHVPLQHAALEFKSEQLHTLDGKTLELGYTPIGGLHKTSDGHVRIHDVFPNHREACLKVLGLSANASREDVARKCLGWKAKELEATALQQKAVIYALRSFVEWDATPQARSIPDFPTSLNKIGAGPTGLPSRLGRGSDKCLRGLRVLEMSRVIAAPVAGKTLAAHGADVLWVTSPSLPALPSIDCEFSRGKRTIQLDLTNATDSATLFSLLDDADVFIQGYRPGSLSARGLTPEAIAKHRPGIVLANLSAFPSDRNSTAPNPWAHNRGFDSMVQTCSGINEAEAVRYDGGESSAARVLPCQALDHASGYLLATGIMAALYKRQQEGGSYLVEVSLAGVAKYLRSLGQYEGRTGYEGVEEVRNPKELEQFCKRHPGNDYMEERPSGLGLLRSIKHSASIEGVNVGFDIMPKPLGSDEAVWL